MLPRLALVAVILSISTPVSAVTYQFNGLAYPAANIANYTPPCTLGVCANYTTAMRVTGQFTTAAPLPINLNYADIYPLVTSYSFSDGVNTYDSAAPGVRPERFRVLTNAGGQLLGSDIIILSWQDNLPGPHAANSRYNIVSITTLFGSIGNNGSCTAVGNGALVADACTAAAFDSNFSSAASSGGAWSVLAAAATAVPTLSTGPLALLATLLAAMGVWWRRA